MTLVPGHKDGVVQEILKDFAVLSLLFLSLLLGFGFGASTARPFLSTTYFSLGILCHLFDVNGPVGILPDGDFICSEKGSPMRVEMKAQLHMLVRTNNSHQYYLDQEHSWFPTKGLCCHMIYVMLGCGYIQTVGGSVIGAPPSTLTFGAVIVPVEVAVLGLSLPSHDVVTQVAIGQRRRVPLHN